MQRITWRHRARIFAQRFWQPASACMTCMPGSLAAIGSLAHWKIALQTGLVTGVLAVLVSLTPLARLYIGRWSNALMVALLTMAGDYWAHRMNGSFHPGEVLLTGAIAGLLALVASYVFEDRARRVRALWARIRG
jgi:hypothetical protein